MGNNITHSLTAYRFEFSYLERNNPLKDELKEQIKNKEKPIIDLKDILNEVIMKSNAQSYLKASGSAFKLTKLERVNEFDNGLKIVIIPDAGKSDLPFTVYKENSNIAYHYSSGSVSTYQHNIYFYIFGESCYMICHRRGHSGCKTVLLHILNEILKQKGIKTETNVIMPISNKESNYIPQKMNFKYKTKQSSDIADKLRNKTKNAEIIVRELSINLDTENYSKIRNLIGDRIENKITKDSAFVEIKRFLNDDYNDAEIVFRIGKARRTVSWDNLDEVFQGKDITDDLEKLGGAKETNISECADEFIKQIRSNGL